MIFIQGNVPSLKNSKIKTSFGIFPSKTVQKYLKSLGIKHYSVSKKNVEVYKTKQNIFETYRTQFDNEFSRSVYPLKVGIHFVRGSKHKFDFNNATQIIADLLVAHNFIDDDDMDHFLPFPMEVSGEFYSYNKNNPGVYLENLDTKWIQ